MHEETNFAEQFKKNAKRSKPPPSLSIPDPIDLFKLELLNRPPSVPILGRRLSSESHLNNKDRNSPVLNSRVTDRQFRRKSIPDRLKKKSSIVTKKSEGKLKVPQKYPDTKPPLDKSSKLLKVKSSKTLIKKSNLSTPHLNKIKKTVNKLLGGEFIDKRKFENNTPNKVIRKNSDGKECEELRRNQFEPRNLIVKHTAENFTKPEKLNKPAHKSSRSALSLRHEDRTKVVRKKSKKMVLVDNNRVTSPPKKRAGKKSEGAERSSSQSKTTKKRQKSKKSGKKIRKQSSEGKPKYTKEPKIIVAKPKIPRLSNEIKEDMTEKWLEHSFFMNSKNKQIESLDFDENLYEDPVINFNVSDLQSSNEAQLNFSIPSTGGWLSKISSVPVLSVPDTMGNRPKSPIPPDLERSNRVKIFKRSVNAPNKSAIQEKAAISIQRVFRGYRTRKDILEDRNKALKTEENEGFALENSLINKKLNKLFLNYSSEEEQQVKLQNSLENIQNSFEENTDKSDYQAPKPAETIIDPQFLSPINNGVLLKMTELTKRIKQEQKNYEILERDSKEVENLLYLDTLKQKKASIDDLRKKDLEDIKNLTPNNGSESQIFDIFQNIINRRYETINSMFDENIKAVQEALAQPVLTEESSIKIDPRVFKCKDMPLQTSETVSLSAGLIKNKNDRKIEAKIGDLAAEDSELSVKAVDFKLMKKNNRHEARFYKNLEKCANKVNIESESRAKSPEILSSYLVFRNMPQPSKPIYPDPEVPQTNSRSKPDSEPLGHSSKIVWIDEVAMPSNIDLTDLLIESSISELYQFLLSDLISDLFRIPAQFIKDLSEELVMAILLHEIQDQVQEMRKDYDEESILNIIQKVFIKTQNLIVTELLKPLEKDPLLVLSEIQEAEIGCGFLPEEKYAMLNWEAFQDDLTHSNLSIKIFNTMVFDCINECLERLIVKEDLPWASVKYKKILVRTSEDVVNYIVNRLIKFSEIRAGEIVYEEIGNDSKRSEKENIQKRELDIVKMLAIEVVEDEMEWVKYDKEELQGRLDLADMILEQEIDGIVEILFSE